MTAGSSSGPHAGPGGNEDFVADADVARQVALLELADADRVAVLRNGRICFNPPNTFLGARTVPEAAVRADVPDDADLVAAAAANVDAARPGADVEIDGPIGRQFTLEATAGTGHSGFQVHRAGRAQGTGQQQQWQIHQRTSSHGRTP